MKKSTIHKRLLALLLALVMIFACGCSAAPKDEPVAPVENDKPAAAPTEPSKEETAEPAETGKDLSWLNKNGELPMVAEGTEKTLSILVSQAVDTGTWEDKWLYHFIQDVMNINLEVTVLSSAEQLSLVFAGGELPDLILGASLTAEQLVRYGAKDGQLLDLAPYINEEYMPNLTKLYDYNPGWKSVVTDAEGHVWSLGLISGSATSTIGRAYLNMDWLSEANLDAPETLDEFTDMLRAFKQKDESIVPLGGSDSTFSPASYVLNAFGYDMPSGYDPFNIALRDDEVVYVAADREAYGEYLKYMNTLYTEGLIHQDFFTMDDATTKAITAEGKNGVIFQAPYVLVGDTYNQWWGAKALSSDYNANPEYTVANPAKFGGAVVSADCEEIELVLTFLDYFYNVSDDLREQHYNYQNQGAYVGSGWEDLGGDIGFSPWEIDEAGNSTRANTGYGKYDSAYAHLINAVWLWKANAGFGAKELRADFSNNPSDVVSFAEKYANSETPWSEDWGGSGDDHYNGANLMVGGKQLSDKFYPFSAVYFDADTQQSITNTLVAIKEYAKIETAKFITGQRSFDELNDYFDTIESLGVQEVVQAYTDYYAAMN